MAAAATKAGRSGGYVAPVDVRRIVAGVGRTLIGTGVLLLLFVAYQLWGTNLREARSQRSLRSAFEQVIDAADLPDESPSGSTTTTLPPPPVPGEAVAIIEIPKIGVDKAVVEGVGVGDLKKGPGHYPGTPMPGQPGNAAIAGHRTTYGAPFWSLDELRPGDEILVTTRQGRFRYEVESSTVVKPSQTEVLLPTEHAQLTLTTCEPRYSARRRLIVKAKLVDEPAPAPPATVLDEDDPPVSFEEPSLSGERAARGPVLTWGLLAALTLLVTWWTGRRWRRLPAYVAGGAVLLVVLFVWFEHVARLLPANI